MKGGGCLKRPSKAMEAWPRLATSFSSLPTSTSSSSSSSSASLHPPLLLDLADELWFSRSVVPFPSFSLPCFPSLFSSLFSHSPDPSTLLAQLMFSTSRSIPLSSSPSPPPLQQPVSQQTPQYSPWDLPAYHSYPPPSDGEDEDAYDGEDEDAYHGYAVQTYRDACSYGEIEDPYLAPRCGEDKDAYPTPGYGNVEDAYRYGEDRDAYPMPADYGNVEDNSDRGKRYPAPGYGLDEDAYEVCPTPANDRENAEHADMIEQKFQDCEQDEAHPADSPGVPTDLDAEDALSGIYDAGVILKDQYHNGREDVQHHKGREDVLDVVLSNSWPRTEGPFQDGEKCKYVKTNIENRELDIAVTAPQVSRSLRNDGRRGNSVILSYVPIQRQILPVMSAPPSVQVLSCNEQDDVKEHLKLWAHAVASTLHWKAAMQAKQVW